MTPEEMRKIAREEIQQHEKNSEKILEAELSLIHSKLKEIQDSMKLANQSDRNWGDRLISLEGKVKALFAWKDNTEQAPARRLNSTSKIVGIVATILSILTSAAMIAVFKALVSLGDKL